MKHKALIVGVAAVASLGLLGYASGPSASSEGPKSIAVSGTIVTTQPIRVTSDPGSEAQPNPQPGISDSGWLQLCKDERILMAGSTRWYCGPRGDVVSLEGKQVTIKDAKGGIVGLTTLALESGSNARRGAANCSWSFTLNDFKSASKFFTVEVDGVPGTQNVSRADLLAGLTLTAG